MANQWLSKIVLCPMSWLYGMVVYVRNKLFDLGLLRQTSFKVPIVVVGNLATGGTGKTPHVEYIVRELGQRYNIGIVSRGYMRQTKGYVLASPNSTPGDIGDEPYQMYRKFMMAVPVAVCEDRVKGIEKLLETHPEINLVILDDAFQHRYVKADASIVITEYNRPIFNDHLLPYGRLREQKHGLARAQIVIVSKCKESLKAVDYTIYDRNLDLFPYQKSFYTGIVYENLQPVFPESAPSVAPSLNWLTDEDMVLIVAGIARPKPFVKYIRRFRPRVWVNIFPDHHNFTRKDMELLESRFTAMTGAHNFLITTEKDAVRMSKCPYFPAALKPYTYYLPISVKFQRDEAQLFANELRKLITKH